MTILPLSSLATIHWVYSSESIQLAVNSAVEGDTVMVEDGVYSECVKLYGKRLTVASQFLLDGDSTHISQTVVVADSTCLDTASCFVYAYNEPAGGRLWGLTLVGGRGTYWSASGNQAGGNIFVNSSRVSIGHCRILNGLAQFGGGLMVYGEPYAGEGVCDVTASIFSNCRATAWGGGIYASASSSVYASSCSLRVNECTFDGDTADATGGGLSAGSCYLGVDGSRFVRCYGQVGGCEIINVQGYLRNSIFEQNGNSGTPLGSHLQLSYSAIVVAGCSFRENTGLQIPIMLLGGGGLTPVRFLGNLVENNLAILHSGIIQCGSDAVGEIAYNIIRNNIASYGGAVVAFDDSHPRIHHNVFDHNESMDSTWGAVFLTVSNGHPTIDSNIIVHHRPPIMMVHPNWPQLIDARNNWWGHPTGPYNPTFNPSGQGDTLLGDSILFIPWLTEPPDTTMPENYLSVQEPRETPETWELMEAYPNPFNSSITLVLAGFTGNDFDISLYNLLGQQVDVVHRGAFTGGQLVYQAPPWLASGVYLLSAKDRHAVQTKKVILLK